VVQLRGASIRRTYAPDVTYALVGIVGVACVASGVAVQGSGRNGPAGMLLAGLGVLLIAAGAFGFARMRRGRAKVNVEGDAHLCRSHHMRRIASRDARTGRSHGMPDDDAPLHVDLRVRAWNSGGAPVTLLGVEDARVGGQRLRTMRPAFERVLLAPDGRPRDVRFALRPPAGDILVQPIAPERLRFSLRASDGHPRRVQLRVHEPR
jgi:hypothetical protein